ncbi:hypothetical protein QTP70_029207, partial [Hemibagrus guttatus]
EADFKHFGHENVFSPVISDLKELETNGLNAHGNIVTTVFCISVVDRGSALASFIKSTLPKLTELEPLLEVLQELGVQELEDLNYIQESDLLHVLKPVEVSLICFFCFFCNPSGGYNSSSSNSPISESSSSMDYTPCQLYDNSWYS